MGYENFLDFLLFGAFFAFMGVNIASMKEYFFNSKNKTFRGFMLDFLPPTLGFIICLIIWLNLPLKTFLIGGGWMLTGIIYLAIRTKGFREKMAMIDFTDV